MRPGFSKGFESNERDSGRICYLTRIAEEVVAVAEGPRGELWGGLKDRRGDSDREMVWWLALRHAGMTLRTVEC